MQKHIKLLIPIDFTPTTLDTIEWVMSVFDENPVEIIFLLAREMEYSMTEALTYKTAAFINEVMPEDFKTRLIALCQTYSNTLIQSQIEVFHGNTAMAMMNFLEIQEIDCICLPPNGSYQPSKDSFDPTELLQKSEIARITMPIEYTTMNF